MDDKLSMSLGSNRQIILDADARLFNNDGPTIKLQGGEISASDFFVSSEGSVTASKGRIAGWEITDTDIQRRIRRL